jgi:3-oxoacyl-[acyl-carrier-protein] synthase-1
VSVFINGIGINSALGSGLKETAANLFSGISPGMLKTDKYSSNKPVFIGAVDNNLPSVANFDKKLRSRNNQLLLSAFQEIEPLVAKALEGIDKNRVAIIIGTSTSGISDEEEAFPHLLATGKFPDNFDLHQREFASPSNFLAALLGTTGPTYSISTACTSSAKALASGARLLKTGLVDVVIVGGVDSLCKFTIAGFDALESIPPERTNPFSINRNGINIGEAAALFLMSMKEGPYKLTGWGESSDGHHISAPDPAGIGAALAINSALSMSKLGADDIDYVNLHGTGTQQNDAMEAGVISRLFGDTAASSTKPLTGHTLGAAGAVEAIISCLALEHQKYPPHLWDKQQDPALPILNFNGDIGKPINTIMTNNFAFGGNNTSLIIERS